MNTIDHVSFRGRTSEDSVCTVSREFSVGNVNLVREIQFDDGAWIARLQMPPIPDQDGGIVLPSCERSLLDIQSELATMELGR